MPRPSRPVRRRPPTPAGTHTVARAVAVALVAAAVPSVADAAPCWPPPVEAPVVDPYRPPACPWCPGNRGISYGTAPGAVVRAVAAGRVTFAGDVAGTVYVVVQLANGWRVTYGNLTSPAVAAGDAVVVGMVVGRTAGAFHFGLRERAGSGHGSGDPSGENVYLDPTPYLGVWRYRARLIPLDGSAGGVPPAPVLRCLASR